MIIVRLFFTTEAQLTSVLKFYFLSIHWHQRLKSK
nr:MAG TPA: hypothetical protein [Siphoviridae sp. ctBfm1]DAR77138.1 MAG TPA: hypothetical protein [Caudoviricetes sp.]